MGFRASPSSYAHLHLTFLFVYVFPTRYGGGAGASQDDPVNILAGIVCWLAFQDVLSRSNSTFISHANLVKQIVFPIEVLSVKTALASAIPYSVGLAFLLASVWGLLWDIRELTQVFCTVNLFAQSILFNPYATPQWLKYIFQANPFSYFVWCWQDALFFGSFRHPKAWVVCPFSAGASFGWGGSRSARPGAFLETYSDGRFSYSGEKPKSPRDGQVEEGIWISQTKFARRPRRPGPWPP
ncbi:MAG: hypothetical protein KKC78_01505 [Proteobacteria bacterium]|nr:hypothetical protein [Pseudomonadota bacterium]